MRRERVTLTLHSHAWPLRAPPMLRVVLTVAVVLVCASLAAAGGMSPTSTHARCLSLAPASPSPSNSTFPDPSDGTLIQFAPSQRCGEHLATANPLPSPCSPPWQRVWRIRNVPHVRVRIHVCGAQARARARCASLARSAAQTARTRIAATTTSINATARSPSFSNFFSFVNSFDILSFICLFSHVVSLGLHLWQGSQLRLPHHHLRLCRAPLVHWINNSYYFHAKTVQTSLLQQEGLLLIVSFLK